MVYIRRRFRKPANIKKFIIKPGYYEVANNENKIGYSSGWLKGNKLYCYFFEQAANKWEGDWYALSEESLKKYIKEVF